MNNLEGFYLNGKEYAIICETKINGILYVHLANVEDYEDFCIRKVIVKDGKEILTKLDNKEEFYTAFSAFCSNQYKTDEI